MAEQRGRDEWHPGGAEEQVVVPTLGEFVCNSHCSGPSLRRMPLRSIHSSESTTTVTSPWTRSRQAPGSSAPAFTQVAQIWGGLDVWRIIQPSGPHSSSIASGWTRRFRKATYQIQAPVI